MNNRHRIYCDPQCREVSYRESARTQGAAPLRRRLVRVPGRPDRAGFSWGLLIASLCITGAGLGAGFYYLRPAEKQDSSPFEYVVKRSTFVYETSERGELESSRNVEVRCQVPGRGSTGTAILELVPEGTFVHQGDVLAKLDDSALQAELQQHQIVCNTSGAAVTQARNVYETALIARLEYLEGTFKQEEQLILNEMLVAEENLRRAQQFAKYSRRLAGKGYLSPLQLDADEFAVDKARNEMESAQTKLRVLRDFNKEKMVKQLDSDINIARANLDSAEKSYALDLAKLQQVQNQIANCVIRAPSSGEVVYANDRSRRDSEPDIIEGALVRERQVMFRLPDTQHMQVKTKVNESRVGLVAEGMPAKIRLDSSWGQVLEGRVTRVESYPIPTRWSSSNVKDYAAYVEVLNPVENMRPGLAAQVSILIEQRQDALMVPVQAVMEHGRQHYCLLNQNGQRQLRQVKIGSSNDKFVIVEDGISEGDIVLQNPHQFINETDLPSVNRNEAIVQGRWNEPSVAQSATRPVSPVGNVGGATIANAAAQPPGHESPAANTPGPRGQTALEPVRPRVAGEETGG